ncbi:hypothetical protein [Denitromonas iodatirespirans]|uniref:Uncharacterized protein n=1 Tax=Denitromonas iodatirespirans TaxID=2795389 RepID=A0A944D9K9_DENI1|nr:hypothetical protein [Denitromonas iodatirespirans]MBT0960508.1 hypothetical protein [Denitromonas iodatirespirans]
MRTPVSKGEAGLLKAFAAALPEWRFRHALTRGGWYRLGGVVDADGQSVMHDLEAWAQAGLDACNGDAGAFEDAQDGRPLYATRLTGKTHYFVAPAGGDPDAFLQLEVEELQEMRAHRLFASHPSTVDEIVDPRDGAPGLVPIGLPCFQFRRLQHIGAFFERMRSRSSQPSGIERMLIDWAGSSADGATCFSNHWVVSTREHVDHYHQPVFRARPIPAMAGEPPDFEADPQASGVDLAGALTRFDRAVGYPMAWYFHMLTTKAVPHWVARSVVEDMLSGFAYLPDRDIEVVRGWLHSPYGV